MADNPNVSARRRRRRSTPPTGGSPRAPSMLTSAGTGFQQCGRCLTFVISSGSAAAGVFLSHMENCWLRMPLPKPRWTVNRVAGGEIRRFGGGLKCDDWENMTRLVTFPVGRVKLRRLSPVEIEEFAGGRRKCPVRVPELPSSSSGASAIPPPKGPRQSSLKISHAVRQMFENMDKYGRPRPQDDEHGLGSSPEDKKLENEDHHYIDEDDEDEANDPKTPKFINPRRRRRPSRRKTAKPPVPGSKSAKMTSGGAHPKTSDQLYSFHCRRCTAFFDSQVRLEKHVQVVHDDSSHQSAVNTCPICDKMMWKRLPLYSHLKTHTDAEAVEDAFNLWEPWPEPKNRNKMRFSCKHCLMPHLSHHSFVTHMRAKHPDKFGGCKWTCRYCSTEEFSTLYSLVKHIRDNHRSEFWDRKDDGDANEEPAKRSCDIYGKMFDVYHLRQHKLKEHPKNYKDKVKSKFKDSKYPCPLCDKNLKTVTFLKDHFISRHLRNNPFTCKVPGCNVRYDNQSHLNRHMANHTGEETKSAEIPQTNNLAKQPRIDINRIMLSDPVFIKACKASPEFEKLMAPLVKGGSSTRQLIRCTKCNILYNNRKGFLLHSKQCKGSNHGSRSSPECPAGPSYKEFKMKFCCPICGTAFDTKELCNHHLQNEHDPKKIFKCDKCYEIFSNKRSLSQHLSWIHLPRPYPCSKCKKKFTSETILACHMKRHDSPPCKIRECPECGKVLSNGTSARRHCFLVHGIKLPLRMSTGGGASKTTKKMDVIVTKSNAHINRKIKAQRKDVIPDRGHESEAMLENPDLQEEELAYRLVKVESELIIDPEDDVTTTESCASVPSPAVPDFKIETGTSSPLHVKELKKELSSPERISQF